MDLSRGGSRATERRWGASQEPLRESSPRPDRKGAVLMKKRILVLMTVVAMMMAMMAMSVAPAFAAAPYWSCNGTTVIAKYVHYYRAAGYECVRL